MKTIKRFSKTKIMNTNAGPGFIKGRKYDTDLDRLGRMETSHSEMRKLGDLRSETRKLHAELNGTRRMFSIPRISQKYYGLSDIAGGVVNGARDLTGNVVHGVGSVADSGVGKLAGGLGGAALGAKAGLAAGFGMLGPLGILAAPAAMGLGALAGGALGSTLTGAAGKTLKSVGDDIHT